MQYRNITLAEMRKALALTNRKYEGNLRFLEIAEGRFTLGVTEALAPGGRRGRLKFDGTRRIVPERACWHAHGHFFESVFKVQPKAVIVTRLGNVTGPTKEQGNWTDAPLADGTGGWFSDLCECKRDVMHPHKAKRAVGKRKVQPLRPEGLIGAE